MWIQSLIRAERSGWPEGVAAIKADADARAADIAPTIKGLQAGGATSLRELAAGLNKAGIPTARGQGNWSAKQVQRALARI